MKVKGTTYQDRVKKLWKMWWFDFEKEEKKDMHEHFSEQEVNELGRIAKKLPNIIGFSNRRQFKISGGKVTSEPCVRFYVTKKKNWTLLAQGKKLRQNLNLDSENISTDIVEIGEMKILAVPNPTTGRTSMLMAGSSIAHENSTAGTNAGVVFDRITDMPMVLSNRHVFAPVGSSIGDRITQPGPMDIANLIPSDPSDSLYDAGRLYRTVMLMPENNTVDAAVMVPTDRSWVRYSNDSYQDMSTIHNMQDNDRVKKIGRTTGYTPMIVMDNDAAIEIRAEDGNLYGYIHVALMAGTPDSHDPSGSNPGDSGSMIVWEDPNTRDEHPTGLLFAGSDTHTMACHMNRVLDAMGAKLTRDSANDFFGEAEPWPEDEVPPVEPPDDEIKYAGSSHRLFLDIEEHVYVDTYVDGVINGKPKAGENFTVDTKLIEFDDDPLVGKIVMATVDDGEPHATTTDEEGKARFFISGLPVGEHTIDITFEGDDKN